MYHMVMFCTTKQTSERNERNRNFIKFMLFFITQFSYHHRLDFKTLIHSCMWPWLQPHNSQSKSAHIFLVTLTLEVPMGRDKPGRPIMSGRPNMGWPKKPPIGRPMIGWLIRLLLICSAWCLLYSVGASLFTLNSGELCSAWNKNYVSAHYY